MFSLLAESTAVRECETHWARAPPTEEDAGQGKEKINRQKAVLEEILLGRGKSRLLLALVRLSFTLIKVHKLKLFSVNPCPSLKFPTQVLYYQ